MKASALVSLVMIGLAAAAAVPEVEPREAATLEERQTCRGNNARCRNGTCEFWCCSIMGCSWCIGGSCW